MKKVLSVFVMLIVLGTFVGCAISAPAGGSDYPKDTVKIIVPFGPGGGSDTLARAVIANIDFPVSLVAVNIDGADGMVGAMECYNTKADGYTIMTHNCTDLMSYSLSGTTEIELYKELVSICDLVADYNLIATNKQSGWKTIDEMVAYAKANPGAVKWSCTGAQNIDYATTVLTIAELGLTDYVTIVPYDGGAESRVALMGNHVQVTTNTCADLAGVIAGGDIVPLLVVNDARIKAFPDVPATPEKGVNVTFALPRGFYAPKDTPQEAITLISDAMKAVSEKPEFIKAMEGLGFEIDFKTGAEAHSRAVAWGEMFKPIFAEMFK